MKKVLSFLFILLLLSCSMMKLGYNNADWLLTWRIDDYFDLTSDQQEFVESRLEHNLSWHRNTELPRYSKIIDEMIYRTERGISAEDYDWAIAQFRDAYSKSLEKIIPDATTFLMNLQPEQIDFYIEATADRYRDEDDDDDKPQRTMEERQQRRSERTIARMEEWFGELSIEQKEKISQLTRSLPRRSQYFHEDRLRRHNEFIALLKSNISEQEFAERLGIHFTDFEKGRSEAYKEATEQFNEAARNMAVEISLILTQEQKEYAYEIIRGYQIDFIELAANE